MPRRTPGDARRRTLSQNFLHDQQVVADIVATLHPPPGALVLDLGAGAGALTRAVAAGGNRVLAVELDPRWVGVLRSRAPAWGDVTVVAGDALHVPFPAERFLVVSNAPYAIGTKLVRRLLTDAHGLTRAVVVLQREAALRLAGGGRFAASWAPWFELTVHRRVPARAFRPVPSVDGAMLTVVPRAQPLLSPAAYPRYDAFLTAAFSGRGNTLARRLNVRPSALAALGLPRDATPGAVPPEVYARVFTALE
ncbi:methyltransferase domain-containing protein [Solirubrobacter sp. CPCC 204708]|uniref:rRNA adenine N(6)-methyltransferase family protein n=1 Tax=Solirubrobacter deserti TaxID=2282478 RepID=A0ABT4RKV5_9ACTN|nr:rRNA adenine dimethyltransferase family protein [Solirubrobacter deserti]MBE2319053.1 methyltransferase domain-containing protein [Solirubrobacter deserti]MDA0139130.1 rRNA adenine N(6)-methyltransferase family protein [Solirubrobacter deserti]